MAPKFCVVRRRPRESRCSRLAAPAKMSMMMQLRKRQQESGGAPPGESYGSMMEDVSTPRDLSTKNPYRQANSITTADRYANARTAAEIKEAAGSAVPARSGRRLLPVPMVATPLPEGLRASLARLAALSTLAPASSVDLSFQRPHRLHVSNGWISFRIRTPTSMSG